MSGSAELDRLMARIRPKFEVPSDNASASSQNASVAEESVDSLVKAEIAQSNCVSAMPQAHTPIQLNLQLKPHQKFGLGRIIQWMEDGDSNGGIIADEMGLGKTLMMIAALCSRPPPKYEPALILTPSALMKTWHSEFKKSVGGTNLTVLFIHPKLEGMQRKRSLRPQDLEGVNVIVATTEQVAREVQTSIDDSGYTDLILTEAIRPR